MSKAAILRRNVLNPMTEKYIGRERKDIFSSMPKKSTFSIMENVSKDSIVEILDQILEYSTRSKKDLDTDNAEMLKVDLAQIISFSQQLQSLIEEDGGMETDSEDGSETTEETVSETTEGEATAGPE